MPSTPILAATSCSPWLPPLDYVQRVRAYYRRTSAAYEQPAGTIWHRIANGYRQTIHQTLLDGTDADVAAILGDPASHDLNYGMDPLAKGSVETLRNSAPQRDGLLNLIVRTLEGAAETIGARRVWNPESHAGAGSPQPDADVLVAEIDQALGCRLPYPNKFPNEYGLATQRGIIGRRVPFAIHHAWLLSNLAAVVGNSRIIEVGGGLGRTAIYARSLGLVDYTIVDIPLTFVSQAAFLGATLGPDSVCFDGEPAQKGAVRLVPPDWIDRSNERFGITLNVDSLTEMSELQAREYVKFAAKYSSALLSINHEANRFRVFDIPGQIGARCHYQRALSSLRRGYVEECFLWKS